MFDFNRITLFCLEKRLSKQKMTIFSKHFGGHGLFGSPRATPMLLGNIQQPWTVVRPYGNSQFFLSPMERRRQPGPGPHEFRPDHWLPGRRVLGKFPRSQNRPSFTTPPRLQVPAHSDPVKRWKFRKADWQPFCLLAGESVERLPPTDTSNIERAWQDFC